MRHVIIASVLPLLVACGGSGPSAPPAPVGSSRPPLLESFAAARGLDMQNAMQDDVSPPTELGDLFYPSGEALIVEAGRLDGQIGEVRVAEDADEQLGFLDSFGGYTSLMATVSAHTERGVAMLIFVIDDGFDSRLFLDGELRGDAAPPDPEALEGLTVEELEELFLATSVMGCSGDSLAEISWDEMATEYTLVAEPDPSTPSRWSVTGDVRFIDPASGDELDASASFELERPE